MITIITQDRYNSKKNMLDEDGDGFRVMLDMAYKKDWGKLKKVIDEINETKK